MAGKPGNYWVLKDWPLTPALPPLGGGEGEKVTALLKKGQLDSQDGLPFPYYRSPMAIGFVFSFLGWVFQKGVSAGRNWVRFFKNMFFEPPINMN
jgi:hypothetical protein